MRLFLLSIIILIFQTTEAQERWSLDKCVNYAIEHNITVKQQVLNVNYKSNLLKQSKFDLAPTVNASLGHNFQYGKSTNIDNTFVNVNSQVTSFDASANVVLFNAMAKQNTIKQRNFEFQAALEDLEKTKDDITLAVVSAYLEILFNKELVTATKAQTKITKQQIDYNKKLVEAGKLAAGKIFETEAQLANEQLTLTNYENKLQMSVLNLTQLLELQTAESFDIETPVFDIALLDAGIASATQVFDSAVTKRPEIKSKELILKSIEAQSKIAKAQVYPSLSAFASYNNFYNNKYVYASGDKMSFSDQLDFNGQKLIGFRLQIPVFNGLQAQTDVKNTQISYLNSKNELQLEKNNLRKEIEQVHLNAVAAMKKYYSSQKAVESAKEAFRYAEEKFKLGIVTPLEYNDAKNKVTNAESSFIQAKYEYIFRIKILDFYMGKPVSL